MDPRTDGRWTNDTLGLLGDLDSSRLAATGDDFPDHIVNAARSASERLLHLSFTGSPRRYTTTNGDGDAVAARWQRPGGFDSPSKVESEVWLWDDAWRTRFVIVLPGGIVRDPALLGKYCEGLFVWNDAALRSLTLRRMGTTDGRAWTLGGFDQATPARVPPMTLHAVVIDGQGAILISIPKPLLDQHYPAGGSRIPERFPPLADRLKAYTRATLMAELGRGYPEYTYAYPKERDTVIATELLGRGELNMQELREAALGPFATEDDRGSRALLARTEGFLDACAKAGQLQGHVKLLLLILRDAPLAPSTVDDLADLVLSAAGKADIDASAEAAMLAEGGRCGYPCFKHIARESTEQSIARLIQLKLMPELAEKRDIIVLQVRRRLPPKR